MPVNEKEGSVVVYQREVYQKGGVGRKYWDFPDDSLFSFIRPEHHDILDLGCGEGITLEKLEKLFPQKIVLGIDPIPENVEICHRHHLNVQFGDAYRLPLADNCMDAVTMVDVIENLNSPQTAMKEVYRVLPPGGRAILVFPNDIMFLVSRLCCLKFKEAFYDPGHVRQWTPGKLKKLLNGKGFQTVASIAIPLNFWPYWLHGIMVVQKPENQR